MLFLYRPRQTRIPYRMPRPRTQQDAYNLHLQEGFAATQRVAPQSPAAGRDPASMLNELVELHDTGVLTDAELAAAKARLLDAGKAP